jgi:ABC-type Fe3+/spermidine/putrescine transport system ATPase subunit
VTVRDDAGPVVRIRGVSRAFGAVQALDGVDLDLRAGETLALLGPSGCGKTTLLRAVAGLGRPDAGTIEIGGRLVEGPGTFVPPEKRRIGMVFQDVALFPHLSVAENVAFGIRNEPDRDARVAELLELVGLEARARHRPHELSGGEQQRVAIARALANRPKLLLADEPTGQLDSETGQRIMLLIRTVVRAEGVTAIVATHDPVMLDVADRVIELLDGHLVGGGAPVAARPDERHDARRP